MTARIEDLPVGLDWPAFLTAYSPGGRRNGRRASPRLPVRPEVVSA